MSMETYPDPVHKLLEIGEPEDPWPDYLEEITLTQTDIPELIRLVSDRDLRWIEAEVGLADTPPEVYAQIHAWRALGQLRAVEAIPALLDLLEQIDELDDDWYGEEAPDVFALIGPPAVARLRACLADQEQSIYARITVGEALTQIAYRHPETRQECIDGIAVVLEGYPQNDETVNGFLVASLADLGAVEKIDLIEQAFQAERVDESVIGDFEDVQVALGLLEERITPEDRPRLDIPPQPPKKNTPRATEKKDKKKRKQAGKSRKKNRKKK